MKNRHSKLLTVSFHTLPPEGLKREGEVTAQEMEMVSDKEVTFCQPIVFNLRLSPMNEGVLCRGKAKTEVKRDCDRCLESFLQNVHAPDICIFKEVQDEDYIDLTDDLRDDILLALPQRAVCQEDCLGLCPECGCNLNMNECDCEQQTDDESPWSDLNDLFSDKEVD